MTTQVYTTQGLCEFKPWRVGRENEYTRDTPAQLWYDRTSCAGDALAERDKFGSQNYGVGSIQYNQFGQNPSGVDMPPVRTVDPTTYLNNGKDLLDLLITNPIRDGYWDSGSFQTLGAAPMDPFTVQSPKGIDFTVTPHVGGDGVTCVDGSTTENMHFYAAQASDRIAFVEGYEWETTPQSECQGITHPDTCTGRCKPGYTYLVGALK